MKIRTASTFASLVLASAVSTLAGAAPAEGEAGFAPTAEAGGGFGAVGELALSLGATADEHLFFHKSGGAWQLQLAPAADYFLAPRVSVGGGVAYGHTSGGTGTNGAGVDTFRLAARAGYAFTINDRFGIWPLGGLSLDYGSANHASTTNTWLTVYAPVLFHAAPHFFLGLGPSAQFNLSGPAGNEYGIDSMLGGWF
jgi:hypothetical protein